VLFGKEVHLDKIDALLEKHEDAIQEGSENNIKLLGEITNISKLLNNHMEREEVAMKEHVGLLREMNDKLAKIDVELATQPKDLELKLTQQKEVICAKVTDKFASKEDLNKATSAIRREAKLAWGVVLAILTVVLALYNLGVFNHGT